MSDRITLEHGSGGALSRQLVSEVIYPYLRNPNYRELSDASGISVSGRILMTTDTYTVDPVFFPGGDIGILAVCGTCNDIAVSGGQPEYLSMGLVLEEGFFLSELKRIMESVAKTGDEIGVSVITGDTKVVPKGKGGGVYINTCGIGRAISSVPLTTERIHSGDRIIISSPLGAHGIAVMAAREGLSVGSTIRSDVRSLYPLCKSLVTLGTDLKLMRDATRGGAASVLNEVASDSGYGIEAEEERFPITENVMTVAEILGLHPLEIANEGVLIAVVSESREEDALELLRRFPEGKQAATVGTVTEDHGSKVVLTTSVGGRRILGFPRGLLLPRIC